MGDLEDRDRLEELIKSDEGRRLKPYEDTATPPRLTIGYGRNLTDKGISPAEALFMFHNDLDDAEISVNHALPWAEKLTPARYAVLISMAFNMGIYGLEQFHNFLRAAESGDYEDAARHMAASLWARQVPRRARRLVAMMRSGNWLD